MNESSQAEQVTAAASLSMQFNPELPSTSRLVIDSYGASPRALKRKIRKSIGRPPEDPIASLKALLEEFELRVYETRKASKRWSGAYYMLGLPAVVLTVIAGAAGLSSTAGRVPAAIIALVAAALTTAATFLNSSTENSQRYIRLSAAWQELADGVREVLLRYGQEISQYHDNDARKTGAANSLLTSIILFNKRKSALLREELTPIPAEPPNSPPSGRRWKRRR